MQQRPEKRAVDTGRSQRAQPAFPGAHLPTTPAVTIRPAFTPPLRKKTDRGWSAIFALVTLGVVLDILYIALYPLLEGGTRTHDVVQQAIPSMFPWVARLYWTTAFPSLVQLLASISWLDARAASTRDTAFTHLLFITLIIASGAMFAAVQIGTRAVKARLTKTTARLLLWTVFLFACLFCVTLLFAPISLNVLSQDMFTYGLYGRMVVVHQVNPYVIPPTAFPDDWLQALLKVKSSTSYGPIWIDYSTLIALLAGNSVANTILGFRSVGIVAHLCNVILLWTILTSLKPEARVSATLLYAWNPLILLLSIAEMHQEVMIVLIVLLAILFFRRQSPSIGWVFILLTALINLLWLPLLPLFFRLMVRQSYILSASRRLLWWLGMVIVSALVIALAYAPFWQNFGLAGLGEQLRITFFPGSAIHSLDAALLNLPTKFSVILWLADPHHWTIFALAILGVFLFLGMWLANTLELVVLFSSWLLVLLLVLLPTYWPWYSIPPLVLAICSTNIRTLLLTLLLTVGALVSSYLLLFSTWAGQGLVTVGLPVLLWGWMLFFSSTWRMSDSSDVVTPEQPRLRRGSVSRPSRPGRRMR